MGENKDEDSEVDMKYRDFLWKISEVKKGKMSEQLKEALKDILEVLGDELKTYREIAKGKKGS